MWEEETSLVQYPRHETEQLERGFGGRHRMKRATPVLTVYIIRTCPQTSYLQNFIHTVKAAAVVSKGK